MNSGLQTSQQHTDPDTTLPVNCRTVILNETAFEYVPSRIDPLSETASTNLTLTGPKFMLARGLLRVPFGPKKTNKRELSLEPNFARRAGLAKNNPSTPFFFASLEWFRTVGIGMASFHSSRLLSRRQNWSV
jgi:hypothetical protein